MEMAEFDLVDGGDVLINPLHVAALIPRSEGGTIIRLAALAGDVIVAEHIGDIIAALKIEVR